MCLFFSQNFKPEKTLSPKRKRKLRFEMRRTNNMIEKNRINKKP
jgi:hypothetical protein